LSFTALSSTRRYKHLSENEHATMSWARRAGFEVPETLVVPPEQVEAIVQAPASSLFLIKRYDRSPRGPIHQEDILQVTWLLSRWKYPREAGEGFSGDAAAAGRRRHLTTCQGLADVVQHLLGPPGVEEYLRRLVLAVAVGNNDAHLKNWSFVYPDRKRPTWSPLYDQVATVVWAGHDELALPLYDAHTFRKVTREHLIRLGTEHSLQQQAAGEIIDQTLQELLGAWEQGLHYPADHASRIRAHWRKCPLTSRVGELARP
jgi:serine/threonine-protein kinase HipA